MRSPTADLNGKRIVGQWRRVSPHPGTAPEIAARYVVCMSKLQDRMIAGFTAGERDYIRRELDMFFSTCVPPLRGGLRLGSRRVDAALASASHRGHPPLPHRSTR